MTWTFAILSLLAVVLVLFPAAQTHPLTQAPVAKVHISSVDLVINSPSLADRSFALHDDSPTIQLEIIPPRAHEQRDAFEDEHFVYIPDCENNGRMKRSIEVEDEAVEVNATTTSLSSTVVPLANDTNGNTTVLPAVTEPPTETEATTIQVPGSSSKLADYSTEIDILEEYTVKEPSSTTKSDDNVPYWDHSFDNAQVEQVDQPDYILCENYPAGEVTPPNTPESPLTHQHDMEVDPFAVSRAIQTQRGSMMTTVPEKDSQRATESFATPELDGNSTTATDSGLEAGTAESVDYNLIEDGDADYWLSPNGDAPSRSPDVSTTEITTEKTISSTVLKPEVNSTTYPAGIVQFPLNGTLIEGPVGGEIKP